MAIIHFFDRGWRQNPDGIAYVMGETSWTYTAAGELSCRIAWALQAAGIGDTGKVAVLAPNDTSAWICVLGTWRAGYAWVPLNPGHPVADNTNLIQRFDCEVLFFHSSLAADVERIREAVPGLRLLVCVDRPCLGAPALDDWVAGHPATRPDAEYRMDDVVAVMPTGGTTGPSKGVMNTHRSFAVSITHMMLAFHYAADERPVNLAAAPMTHTAGIMSLPTSARGGTVVIIPRPRPDAVLDAIERHRITELFLPPTVIYRLLESGGIDARDFSSLRYLIYGAAPMSTGKLRRAIEVFGPVMTQAYGQVEAFAAISYLRPEEHFAGDQVAPDERLRSCGRSYPLVEVEILDDQGRVLGPGETGEICVRGDLVMSGYYKAPDKTAAAIVDGWLHTGDIGHLDGQGYLYLTDRKTDMIISGGFNVYPSEVEQVLWSHAAVQDCTVVGAPHPDWGEAVTAVVELNPGERVDESELIALCKQKLGGVRAPKRIDFVPSLPRSANGKVLRKEVRQRYWAGEGRQI